MPQSSAVKAAAHEEIDYDFQLGYPTKETAQQSYDDADLCRAIEAYRFFYPTVSGAAIIKGNQNAGLIPNKIFGMLDTDPMQLVFTANSDTPYAPILLDLNIGPIVIELPAGPLIVCSMDINQRWVADMGIPGPDAGKGGKHVLLPSNYKGDVPRGYYVHRASSNHQIVGVRSLPVGGDVKAAMALIPTIRVYPLDKKTPWTEPKWIDLSGKPQDTTPLKWERNFTFWEILKETVDAEPSFEGYHNYYGELAALGIEKGKSFTPDSHARRILEDAARIANGQMRVQSFADRRPDRIVWKDRHWQWAALRFEDGDFNTETHTDLEAREKWFFQAIGASPAMFRRDPSAGSLYWLGLSDNRGDYLDGGKSYKLSVPLPVPAKLFWSVTVYDAETRSQVQTKQNKAALRSLFELKDLNEGTADLYFGPEAPKDNAADRRWIQTIPDKGWFAYFRVYGPEKSTFDGNWKPADFEKLT